MTKEQIELLNKAAQIIFDKKGFNILALDVSNLSSITDYILIAEGNVDRHVTAIAHALEDELDEKPFHIEGMKSGDWVVLDYSGVMIHLFMPGMREKYQLERLWPESKIVELDIDYSIQKWAVGEKKNLTH